jgi:hypothetical protein
MAIESALAIGQPFAARGAFHDPFPSRRFMAAAGSQVLAWEPLLPCPSLLVWRA